MNDDVLMIQKLLKKKWNEIEFQMILVNGNYIGVLYSILVFFLN